MSTRVCASNLAQAVKDLSSAWDEAQVHWRDSKSREFHHTYLREVPHHLARTMTVLEELDALLRKVRSDCE